MVHHPAGAERAVSLLIRGERDLDVEIGPDPRGAERLEREDDAGDGALHVGGAAAVDPAVGHHRVEGVAVPPLAGNGDHVVMGVEMHGFLRAGVPEADDVVARPGEQLRLGLFLQRPGDGDPAHLEADAAQGRGQQLGDRAVILPRGVDRAQPDEPLQEGGEVGLVPLEIEGGRHARRKC